MIELERFNHIGFNEQDIEFAKALAIQSSLSLELRKQTSINYSNNNIIGLMESIGQINKSITSNIDLDNLINSTLSLIHQNLKYSRINLFIKKNDDIRFLSCISISDHGIEPPVDLHFINDNNPVGWSISHRMPVVINNANRENRFLSATFTQEVRSELVLPLICGDEIHGILDFCSDVIDTFTPELVRIYQSLADTISSCYKKCESISH